MPKKQNFSPLKVKTTQEVYKEGTKRRLTNGAVRKEVSAEKRTEESAKRRQTNGVGKISVSDKTRGYISSLNGADAKKTKTLPDILKDNYVLTRYGDLGERERKSLINEYNVALGSEKDFAVKQNLQNEIDILTQVGAFRAGDGYVEKRRKFDDNLLASAKNVLGNGKDTYESLSAAQKRAVDYLGTVHKGVCGNISSGIKNFEAQYSSAMSARDIENAIKREEDLLKSGGYADKVLSSYRKQRLEQMLSDAQYREDEDFVKRNFGSDRIYSVNGRNLEMSKMLKRELNDEIAQLETKRADLRGQIDAYDAGAASAVIDRSAAEKELRAIERKLAAAKNKRDIADRFIANRQERLRSEVDAGQVKLYSSVENAIDFEEKSKFDKEEAGAGTDEADYYYKVVNNAVLHNGMQARLATEGTNDEKFTLLTENEKKIFNYYYNAGKKKEAMAYLNALSTQLSNRLYSETWEIVAKRAEEIAAEKDTLPEKLLYTGTVGFDKFSEGFKNMFNPSREAAPPSAVQLASEKIRDSIDSPFWRGAYDLGVTITNMAPSILASTVFGPGAGAALLGASASGNAYQEKINAGWSKGQAGAYAIITGLSEAGLQYFMGGIGKLGGKVSGKALSSIVKGIDSAAARFAMEYGGKMFSEGMEEALQTVLEPFYENLVLQYAKNDLSDVDWGEVAYSGLLGALSAGLLEGGSVYNDTFRANRVATNTGAKIRANGGASALFDVISASPESSGANDLLNRYAKKGVNSENASDLQLGRLYDMAYHDAVDVLGSKKSTVEQMDAAQRNIKTLSGITFDDIVQNGKGEDVQFLVSDDFDKVLKNKPEGGTIKKNELSSGGKTNDGQNTKALGEGRVDRIYDSVWQQSADSETYYERLGRFEGNTRDGLEKGRGLIPWRGRLQLDGLSETRKKERAFGILREISEGRISDVDSEKRNITQDTKDYFEKTVVKNEQGELIPLFHATDNEFNIFEYGDFGFHIGSSEQAITRGGRFIKEVYANIKNPLYISKDRGSWPSIVVANEALSQGVISKKEYDIISKTDGFTEKRYDSPANESLRNLLKARGYDGIVYNNGFEGDGLSFIAFDPEQIKYVSNGSPTVNPDLRYSVSDGEVGDGIHTVLTPEEQARFAEASKRVIEKLGFTVTNVPHVQNMPENVDGYVDFGRREVYVNPNAKNASDVIFKHEITHILERSKGSRYVENIKSYIKKHMKETWDKNYTKTELKYAEIKAKDPNFKVTDSLLESETLADFAMFLSTDSAIFYYANNQPDFARSVADFFKYLSLQIKRVTGRFNEESRIDILALKWERALRKAVSRGMRSNSFSDVMFRFAGKRSDGIEVYEISDAIKAMPYKERNIAFLDIMKNEYRGRTAKFTKNGQTYYAQFEEDDVRKNIYGDKSSSRIGKQAKSKVGAEGDIFELVENSDYVTSETERGKGSKTHKGVKDWDYFAKTVQIDNRVFDVLVNVRKKQNEQYVYYIQLNENKNIEAVPSQTIVDGLNLDARHFDNNRLSQNDNSVNSSYMQNSENDAENDVSFLYVGQRAKIGKKRRLNTAIQMELEGKTPKEIWEETGWGRGQDHLWRYELDDSKAKFSFKNGKYGYFWGKLPTCLQYDELYKAYPFLKNVRVHIYSGGVWSRRASYSPSEKVIDINTDAYRPNLKSSLFHEIQHAIQVYEGFTPGASVEYWTYHPKYDGTPFRMVRDRYVDAAKKLSEVDGYLSVTYARKYCEMQMQSWGYDTPELQQKMQSIRDMMEKNGVTALFQDVVRTYLDFKMFLFDGDSPYTDYEKTAGEIEARDVQDRLKLTEEKRKSRFPKSMQKNPDILFADEKVEIMFDSSYESNAGNIQNEEDGEVLFSVSGGRSVSDIISELEEVDTLLENDALSDEEYRRLDRKSRKLERELAVASFRSGAAKVQQEAHGFFEEASEKNGEDAEAQSRKGPGSYHADRLRDAVENFRETGDSSGIPTRQSAKQSQKYYTDKIAEVSAEIADINKELSGGMLTPEEVEIAEERRDMLSTRRRQYVEKTNVLNEVIDILDDIDTSARPNHTWVNDISHDLSDKKNVVKYGTYGFNDFERNVKHFFGKHFSLAYEKVLKPLFESKKRYAEYVENYSDRIYKEVVKGLGIKKGSKESAAVMWLGEGERPISQKEGSDLAPYTFDDCEKEFGKEKAENIKKAVSIFRECYDEMIDGINETRRKLYPNNPDKLVPKRKDYFRHFQEVSNSVEGLKNAMANNLGIDPMLVGVSEHTTPKSKWQSMAQKRTGKFTDYDAVGGFLNYLPQAAYSTHIDPNIVNIRSLAYDLASAKAKEGADGNPNANGFIRYLQKYANKLAGKTTSHLDRAITDSTVGRPLVAALSWFNNRAKSNAVLGNFSSMLAQFANVTNAAGMIKNQADLVKGAKDALLGLFGNERVQDNYSRSGFLKERFLGKKLDRFEKLGLSRLAADALGIADEIGTRITWNAAFNEAVRIKAQDPFAYADRLTRSCVAGRGIGEIPLNFESTVAKLFLPFRIEVNNNINVYRDILFGNDFEGGKAKKITIDMTDAERYEILRNRKLKVANAKPLVSENVTEADVEKLKTKYKKEAKPILKKLAEFFGVVGSYENKDIELEFEFSNNALRESITKQKKEYIAFAKMLTVFDEVVENAIGIEVHPDKYAGTGRGEKTLKQAYELVSAFSDENGTHPVKLTVKEYDDRNNKLHVAIVLNENGNAVFKQVVPTLERSHSGDAVGKQALQKKATSYSRASSEISLAQLLSIVKDEDFDEYIPKQFKNLSETDFDRILQADGGTESVVGKSGAQRMKQMLKLFVASAIVNAMLGALKSDEFNPLEDLFGADDEDEEERGVFDRLLALGRDYVDGYGDGVVFDPIHSALSGVYQGATEKEDANAAEKVGRSVLRSVQNIAGDYLSNDPLASVAIGAVGADNDAIEKIFNGKLYVSPGAGSPVASSLARSVGYLADGKYASAGAEAAKTFVLPFGGSQVDKTVRGLYEYGKGSSTTVRPYERMVGADEGALKYLIEPNAENAIKSALFGPTAFSGASDAFYDTDNKSLTKEESLEVLGLSGYEARKTKFDDLIAGKEYRDTNSVVKRRDGAMEEYKDVVGEDSVIYQMYKGGFLNASPFRNIPLDMKMTMDGQEFALTVSASDAEAASDSLSAVIAERFRETEGSEKFRAMEQKEKEKYLDAISDLEYKKIKADVLHEKGIMPDDVYEEYVFSYERSRANQDRKLFVDDVQTFVEAQATTMAQQYVQYVGEGRVTDETVRQVQKYAEYASRREPSLVDEELLRLSNALQAGDPDLSDLNASGNPSGVLTYSKNGVEYYIDVPDSFTYEIMATVDDSCRAALSNLFYSSSYKNASDLGKKSMISKVKSNVRKKIKEQLKAKFPSVAVDKFQKILNMGGN